jgi:hypothetical protein
MQQPLGRQPAAAAAEAAAAQAAASLSVRSRMSTSHHTSGKGSTCGLGCVVPGSCVTQCASQPCYSTAAASQTTCCRRLQERH